MAAIDTYRPKTLGYGTRLAAATNAFIGAFSTWNDLRATKKELNRLSDRELDDIGLNRGDIANINR